MIDHCVSAVKRKNHELSFRAYVTDALEIIGENTTNHISMNGMVEAGRKLTVRWIELINNTQGSEEKVEDTRTCDEIVDDIWSRSGMGNPQLSHKAKDR